MARWGIAGVALVGIVLAIANAGCAGDTSNEEDVGSTEDDLKIPSDVVGKWYHMGRPDMGISMHLYKSGKISYVYIWPNGAAGTSDRYHVDASSHEITFDTIMSRDGQIDLHGTWKYSVDPAGRTLTIRRNQSSYVFKDGD